MRFRAGPKRHGEATFPLARQGVFAGSLSVAFICLPLPPSRNGVRSGGGASGPTSLNRSTRLKPPSMRLGLPPMRLCLCVRQKRGGVRPRPCKAGVGAEGVWSSASRSSHYTARVTEVKGVKTCKKHLRRCRKCFLNFMPYSLDFARRLSRSRALPENGQKGSKEL